MRTVNEVSKLTGVSVRTLHYYDSIGLLKPTKTTDTGYRLYDDTALRRLQNILMFRELQFPLKEIKVILDSEGFDPNEALEQQINLLELQLKHIKELICFARKIQKGDMKEMEFQAFSKKEINQYAAEAKEKWGSSKAYKEYEKKTRGQTDEEMKQTTEKLLNLFAKIGSLKHLPPTEEQVQQKISALQTFITENYYNCSDDILNGLGKMYVSDERMTCTVDKAGGEGTAKFVKQAISVYVQKA